jgi:DNA-binding response OmpR family regulator
VSPALVLVSLLLGDLSGLEVCCRLRRRTSVPIVMVTSSDSACEPEVGLDLGADQYVVWPQRRREMVARLRAVLRGANGYQPDAFNHQPFQVGDLHLDPRAYIASLAGRPIQFTPREFELLETLVLHAGRPVSKVALAARVWGADYESSTRRLEHNIRRVRLKLRKSGGGARILSERGVGYRYEAAPFRPGSDTIDSISAET